MVHTDRVDCWRAVLCWTLAVGCMAAGTGCALHKPDLAPPPLISVPDAYSMPVPEGQPADQPWWTAFNDTTLDGLIAASLEQNLSLAQGISRIERAMALRRQVQALRKPQIDLTGSVERQWTRDLDPDEPEPSSDVVVDLSGIDFTTPAPTVKQSGNGSSSDGGSGTSNQPDRDQYDTESRAGLTLSWELDVWGRLRSLARAEGEELAAAVSDYEALRLILSSQVAAAYYEALEQRLQLALLNDQLELARTFLELLELRFVQGDASAVDVLQQRSQVVEIESEVPVAQSRLRLLENRLDVLLGAPPDGADRTAGDDLVLPADTVLPALDVPASLLQRRPDLQALQRRVVAQDYRVGAAMAERLPQLTLDGSLDVTDTSDSSTLAGAMGMSLFQPLLDWGRRKAQVAAEQAALDEALLAFSEAYLVAIEEVETTLWQEARQRELIDVLARRESILARTVEETRVRYSLGVTDYLPVLTALQDLQQVQRSLLSRRRELVSLRIQLHRATGGPTGTLEDSERLPAMDISKKTHDEDKSVGLK